MRHLLTIILLMAAVAVCSGASPHWEAVTTPARRVESVGPAQDGGEQIDVSVRDGYIYVECRSRTTLKVFTILGQLISSETLPAGTHRLRMSAKGIFILKAGSATRRVTL